jgi:hypothetical protein
MQHAHRRLTLEANREGGVGWGSKATAGGSVDAPVALSKAAGSVTSACRMTKISLSGQAPVEVVN